MGKGGEEILTHLLDASGWRPQVEAPRHCRPTNGETSRWVKALGSALSSLPLSVLCWQIHRRHKAKARGRGVWSDWKKREQREHEKERAVRVLQNELQLQVHQFRATGRPQGLRALQRWTGARVTCAWVKREQWARRAAGAGALFARAHGGEPTPTEQLAAGCSGLCAFAASGGSGHPLNSCLATKQPYYYAWCARSSVSVCQWGRRALKSVRVGARPLHCTKSWIFIRVRVWGSLALGM